MRLIAVAALAATTIVIVALGLRVVAGTPSTAPLPDRLVPGLIAAAMLCVAGLTIPRAPAVAWFALTVAAGVGAIEIVAIARGWAPVPSGDVWITLTALAVAATLAAIGVAAAYATASRPGRRPLDWFTPFVAVVAAAVVGGEAWALASAIGDAARTTAAPDIVPIRLATRLALASMGTFVLVGAARDLLPPARRAWRRSRLEPDDRVPSGPRPGLPRLLLEELVPAWTAPGRAASERERARLAAELHATVLPHLRSALAASTATDPTGQLAERLRGTLEDLESVMAERHSAVLETFGLLAALEWLAERVERRGDAEVRIEPAEDEGRGAARPPAEVERAAFRVALLAIDNAVRHAAGSPIVVRAAIGSSNVGIEIVDAGHGLVASEVDDAASRGGRGLPDMRTAAAAVGATLSVDRPGAAPGGPPGTRVAFRWPAR